MFTQSPIEGAIWTSFVAIQQMIVENIILTTLFKTAVATYIGFLFIKMVLDISASPKKEQVIFRFVFAMIISSVGFSILKAKAPEPFKPENSYGQAWNTKQKIRNTPKYSGLLLNTNGLYFYVSIHNAMNQISNFITGKIANVFNDAKANDSPYLLVQTLAQTAALSIDDPKSMTDLEWMFDNCINSRKPKITGENASLSELFDLSIPDCQTRYTVLRQDLYAWAQGKYGTSFWNYADIGVNYVKSKFGFSDPQTIQNKMIASALVNTLRSKTGRNMYNTNNQALLDSEWSSSKSIIPAISNELSIAGILSANLGPITGNDYYGADSRNKSAVMYNQILQFLPPIRGYAKGLLAITFVFAAASMCFGTVRWIVSWFGLLFIFSLYEPLSTMLYESVMLFSNSQDTVKAFGALQNDPLILSGAALIDDNLARIQAVYFCLQLGVAFVCAAGGISIFMFTKRMGSGLSESIVGKAAQYISLARGVPISSASKGG